MSKGSRAWCYTINNYTEEERDALRTMKCTYNIFGYERGDEGTPHLQGYVQLKDQKTLSAMKKVMPRAHLEIRKGTITEAVVYCKKEGDFEEFGVRPLEKEEKGDANKRRYEEAFKAAKEGRLDDIPADIHMRHYGTIKRIQMDYMKKPEALPELDNEWIYGPTGTGKTRDAHARYPDAFIKKANTKWWDGYTGQEVVIIDDFDKYHVALGYELKIWLDHNPFPAETKGSTIMIRPKKVIITSNYHPSEIWQDEQTLEPVLRRVEVIQKGAWPAIHPSYCLG